MSPDNQLYVFFNLLSERIKVYKLERRYYRKKKSGRGKGQAASARFASAETRFQTVDIANDKSYVTKMDDGAAAQDFELRYVFDEQYELSMEGSKLFKEGRTFMFGEHEKPLLEYLRTCITFSCENDGRVSMVVFSQRELTVDQDSLHIDDKV